MITSTLGVAARIPDRVALRLTSLAVVMHREDRCSVELGARTGPTTETPLWVCGYRRPTAKHCDGSQLRTALRRPTLHARRFAVTWQTARTTWWPHDDLIQKRRSGPGATPGPLKFVVRHDLPPHTAPTV